MYQPPLGLRADGGRVTGCREHIDLSRKAATEGMVLLKNEGSVLPLARGSKIALFGKGTIDYVKGGGGSGEVTTAYIRNLYEGMKVYEQAGDVSLYEPLIDFYKKEIQEQYAQGALPGLTVEPELPDDLVRKAHAYADTAIISICRYSGEDWDRKLGEEEVAYPPYLEDIMSRSRKIFDRGDFYLTREEARMVEQVTATFGQAIVVMNVGGMVDTQWFADNEKIPAVLMSWQGGMEGGLATADLLLGKVSPSGHLSDTLAREITDYPSTEVFHDSMDHAEYVEDIYVGYRYFETIPGAKERVNYPFGYGLSYTEFACSDVQVDASTVQGQDIIVASCVVTNIGDMAGKYVWQLYYQAPQGKLGKAARELGAFVKTRELQKGESQRLYLTMPVDQMASYDDLGAVAGSAYVLEAGAYQIYLGDNVRDAQCCYTYELESDVVVEQLTRRCAPYKLTRRMQADGSFETLQTGDYPEDPCILPRQDIDGLEGVVPDVMGEALRQNVPWKPHPEKVLSQVADGDITLDEFMEQLSVEELIHLTCGHRGTGITNTGSMGALPKYGVPAINSADGPAGLRIDPVCHVYTTAFPCATLLASTWNTELVEQVGMAGAREVKENNIGLWLTPAINIHRSPLCGRNFEYYSEDPYLTGAMGTAMVKGIQSQHIGASLKHFAVNNKETNRKESDSIVSERALREIYLKGFEMVVREAQPWTVMSSYNLLNGEKTSESYDLLTGILRQEWGYEGMVTSDWWNHSEHYLEIKAGNDIKMMNGYADRVKEAWTQGVITTAEIYSSARRVLQMILKQE